MSRFINRIAATEKDFWHSRCEILERQQGELVTLLNGARKYVEAYAQEHAETGSSLQINIVALLDGMDAILNPSPTNPLPERHMNQDERP